MEDLTSCNACQSLRLNNAVWAWLPFHLNEQMITYKEVEGTLWEAHCSCIHKVKTSKAWGTIKAIKHDRKMASQTKATHSFKWPQTDAVWSFLSTPLEKQSLDPKPYLASHWPTFICECFLNSNRHLQTGHSPLIAQPKTNSRTIYLHICR